MGTKSKYFTQPNETVEVKILIDTRGKQLKVVSEEEDAKLRAAGDLPEGVVEESSTWAVPNWGIGQWIDNKSFGRVNNNPNSPLEFKPTSYVIARIQALLVDWSLGDAPEGKSNLVRVPASETKEMPVLILNPESMMKISTCNQEIVSAFYTKGMALLYPSDEDRKN